MAQETGPKETGPKGAGLTRRRFLRDAAVAGAGLVAAACAPEAVMAEPPVEKPAPAPTKTPTPTEEASVARKTSVTGRAVRVSPTRTVIPTPEATPTATVTPERITPIHLEYQDFGGPGDSMGRVAIAPEVVDEQMAAIQTYVDDPDTRRVFPDLSPQLNVLGIHMDIGEYPGQDWMFIEDLGADRDGVADDRYWFWHGGQMWPLAALDGRQWGIWRDSNRGIGISYQRNDEWVYPSFQQLGIAQIIAGAAEHPSEEVASTEEAHEVASGDGFRWESYSETNWAAQIGYYWERSALPNPKHPWNFQDGYNVFRIQFGTLISAEDMGDGTYRCTLDAGDKGRMTVTFYNGQEFTRIYNRMYNEQTDPHVPPEVLSDPENSQRALCYPWPVRANKGPLDKEGDGVPVTKLNMASQVGRVIGFGVKEDQRSAHDQGAWLSDLACTLGGDWDSQQLQ